MPTTIELTELAGRCARLERHVASRLPWAEGAPFRAALAALRGRLETFELQHAAGGAETGDVLEEGLSGWELAVTRDRSGKFAPGGGGECPEAGCGQEAGHAGPHGIDSRGPTARGAGARVHEQTRQEQWQARLGQIDQRVAKIREAIRRVGLDRRFRADLERLERDRAALAPKLEALNRRIEERRAKGLVRGRPTHVAAQAARERAKARAAAAGPKVGEARAPGGHVIPIRPDTRPSPRVAPTSPTAVYAQAEPTPWGAREVLARSRGVDVGDVPAPEVRRAEAAGQARRVWALGGEVTPEPRASPELNDEAQRRLTGPVKDVMVLGGGAGVSGIARFADGRLGVWKPAALEKVQRRTIPAGRQWVREVAAYDLAREAGLTDLVPVTVAARIKATHGSLQTWVDGEAPDALPRADRAGRSWVDAQRGYAFDVVTGNTDRHSSNWLVAKGKLQLIDHGLAFPNRNEAMRSLLLRFGQTTPDAPDAVRIAPSVRLLGIPDEVKAPWRDVERRWDEVQRKLLGRGLEPAAVALTKLRLNAFLRADRWADIVGEEEYGAFQAVHAGARVTRTK